MTALEVSKETRADPILSKLLVHLRTNWPHPVPDNIIPFWRRKKGLSIESDCVLWGCRVLIPTKLRQKVLQELHEGHPVTVRMKAVARSHVWWPDIDKAIEECSKACSACQSNKNLPARAPLHPWVWPTVPWERVHVDFAGPFLGNGEWGMFFVATDAHSKWPEVIIMTSTTTTKTIVVLRDMFARNGIPRQIVSDNGPQFASEEFRQFMAVNGVKHIRSSPYHPATNGVAERMVQTMKKSLKASYRDGLPLEQSLAIFLLRYRTTPHTTTGVMPSLLFMGRELRTRLHLLSPDMGARVRDQQTQQKEYHDQHSSMREFVVGQTVWARNFSGDPDWVPATISDRVGPLSYLVVTLRNGDVWRRHIDQLRVGVETPATEDSSVVSRDSDDFTPTISGGNLPPSQEAIPMSPPPPSSASSGQHESNSNTDTPESNETVSESNPNTSESNESVTNASTSSTRAKSRRYPSRHRKPPDRL